MFNSDVRFSLLRGPVRVLTIQCKMHRSYLNLLLINFFSFRFCYFYQLKKTKLATILNILNFMEILTMENILIDIPNNPAQKGAIFPYPSKI